MVVANTVLSLAMALLHVGWAIGAGFLDQGCSSLFFVQRGVLIATCDDKICGNKVDSHLDLNNCILNQNGNMYFNKSGNFYDTCKDCYIAGSSHLTCTCFNNVQDEYIGLVDLNNGVITNYYGYVNCFNTFSTLPAHNWPCKGKDWTPWQRNAGLGLGNDTATNAANGTVALPKQPVTSFNESAADTPNNSTHNY